MPGMTEKSRICFSVPADLLIFSSTISLFSLILCTMWQKPTPLFAPNFFFFFDIVHVLLTPAILLLTIWKSPREIRKASLIGLIILLAIISVEALWEEDLAEVAFANPSYAKTNPEEFGVPEPLITRLVKGEIESKESKDSTPSGFALRQWVLMLYGLFLLKQEGYQINEVLKTFLRCFFPLSFLYVGLARIFRQAHVPVDVAVSMVLGTILFFLAVFVVASIDRWVDVRVSRELLDIHLVFSLISVIIFMSAISNNPGFWIALVFVLVGITGILYRSKEFETSP